MLLFYRYQVNEDGTLTDNDTGRIMYPITTKGKQPYHLVKTDNSGFKYFSVEYLLDKLEVGHVEWTQAQLPEGYVSTETIEIKEGEKMSQVVFDDIIGEENANKGIQAA